MCLQRKTQAKLQTGRASALFGEARVLLTQTWGAEGAPGALEPATRPTLPQINL